MPQSLSKVYLHIIFSTKNRQPFINDTIENALFEYIGGVCKGLECYPVKVGGCSDHVHVLCTLSRKIAQMTLLEEMKKRSSLWIKTQGNNYVDFYWQDGYGAFSVNPTLVDDVVNYIIKQKEHHTTRTFKEEYLAFLKKYDVDFDERYVWD
jgi:putative transposase